MTTPAIIWLSYNLLGLGVMLAKNGERYSRPINFWVALGFFTFDVVLLNWGGFFS